MLKDLQVHAYERSNRVYNYTLDPCGPVYITVGDGGNREKMAIKHADDPGQCPEPSTTPDEYMGGFCATNFTSGPAAGKFCWDQQPDFSALRESSFGHGILEVLSLSLSCTHTHTLSFPVIFVSHKKIYLQFILYYRICNQITHDVYVQNFKRGTYSHVELDLRC